MLKIGSFGAHPALSLNSLGLCPLGVTWEAVPPEGNQVSLGLSPSPALLFLRGSQGWNELEDTPVLSSSWDSG